MRREVGNWQLGEQIGEGGMGIVYLAHHKTLGTPAALKILSPMLSRDPKFRTRFVREARAQANLRHPGIALVIDFIEQESDLYLVVEYLPGGTLAEALERQGTPSVPKALSWARQALWALDHAHQRGVIHRDVKPSNIMLDEVGRLKVVDFGVALVLDGRKLTTTGSLGTPHYMSPEQIRRPLEVDHRTDVYAMGVILYEMLAGRMPFDGESDFDIRQAQVTMKPQSLCAANPEISETLESVVLQALEKEPNTRYQGCGEFAREIEAYEQLEARRTSPPPMTPVTPVTEVAPVPSRGARRWKTGFISLLLTSAIAVAVLGSQLAANRREVEAERTENELLQDQINESEAKLAWLSQLIEAKSWPQILEDGFNFNVGSWSTGKHELSNGIIEISITGGKYAWKCSDCINNIWAKHSYEANVSGDPRYLSVEAIQNEYSKGNSLGLLLRANAQGFYRFSVSQDTYSFWLHKGGDSTALRDWTFSPAIKSNQANRMAVIAEGSKFKLFINDQWLEDISDETLPEGSATVAIGFSERGSASIYFDNFQIRQGPSAATPPAQ